MSKSVLSIGIVGLPNVGKSTLFNALLKRQVALAANYPFATIEPNTGIVDVPDANLDILADFVKKDYSKPGTEDNIPEKIVPATIQFYDIAGLVEGASKGEGLGNKFLSHIREVDAIVQVVRHFEDPNIVREGSVDAYSDIEIINTELILADLSTITTRIEKHALLLKKEKTTDNLRKKDIYDEILEILNSGELASTIMLSKEDLPLIKDLSLLTLKPMFYVFNVAEDKLKEFHGQTDEYKNKKILYICAKIESELSTLTDEDRKLYMNDLGIEESGLDKIIKVGFDLLKLQVYYTAGPKEVRAWTIQKGNTAPQAAGKIHTDFEHGFIKAMIISLSDLITAGGFKYVKDKGFLRMEGKEYIMREGDIVEFRFNV